ncbi:MAG: radical SAM family heme chaperone HemW [Chlorobiaceae bacterium]|nr:radical SAM family heme chaperone HemW [Chlorobiaceae bacterium]
MLSLYVHIPFCRERCRYCDFFLVTRLDHVDRFFTALAEETRSKAELLKGERIGAIHFGGGTPSLVPVWRLSGWLSQVAGIAGMDDETEITLEANPEDIDNTRLDHLRDAGVNRLSIGVQSFTDRKLRALGRAHTAADSLRTVSMAMERFGSVAVDLMCGAAGEGPDEWEGDLRMTHSLRPQHVSVYMLTLEEKTRLWRDVRRGTVELPGEDEQSAMYRAARIALTGAGYRHYEVSNYALDGFHSRYNLSSWKREPYLGFGPSAHSFMVSGGEETRFSNVGSLIRYLDDPLAAVDFREVLTREQRFDEEVFLSLRINRGLPVGFLRSGRSTGDDRLDDALAGFLEKGWIRIDEEVVTLTGEGFLFADLVAAELIHG